MENLTPESPKNRVAEALRRMLKKWAPESPQAKLQMKLEEEDVDMKGRAERALKHLEFQNNDDE